MCFKNLPVQFDEVGRPFLSEGWDKAYTTEDQTVVSRGAPPEAVSAAAGPAERPAARRARTIVWMRID